VLLEAGFADIDPASQSLAAWWQVVPQTLRPLTKLSYALESELGATSAPARRVLQLGMFDSEEKATQKWDDVKSQNSDLLDGLNLVRRQRQLCRIEGTGERIIQECICT